MEPKSKGESPTESMPESSDASDAKPGRRSVGSDKPLLTPMVYSVAEVAALLDIAPWSVYELIKRDEVPGVLRLGSKIVFSRKIINGWLNNEAYAVEHGAEGDSEP